MFYYSIFRQHFKFIPGYRFDKIAARGPLNETGTAPLGQREL